MPGRASCSPRSTRPSRELAEQDPVALLGRVPQDRLTRLAADPELPAAACRAASADLRDYLTEPRWYQAETAGGAGGRPAIAYFSPEYGITAALPQYSGGLGILAGDHLKAASDLGRAADRRRPAVPARLLHPVPVDRGLAGRALPGLRSQRAAADPAARRRRQPGPGQRRPGRRRRAGGADLGRAGRPGAAAAARLLRRGERPGPAGDHRPAVRRRHRPPAAAGTAARHRRRAGGARLLRQSPAIPSRRSSTPTRATPASSASSASASTSGSGWTSTRR